MKLSLFAFIALMASFVIMPLSPLMAQEASEIEGMPGGLYKLDKTHASITWKVSHLGLSNYTARFTDFDIDIAFDNLDPVKSQVRATINPASVETDYPHPEKKDFDAQLANNAGWFNAGQYPDIKFRSTAVKKTGEYTGKVTGDLTFLGVKKPITLDVTFNKAIGNHPFANKPAIGFSATTTLKRSDFGMTKYLPQIGDEVHIAIEAEFLYAK